MFYGPAVLIPDPAQPLANISVAAVTSLFRLGDGWSSTRARLELAGSRDGTGAEIITEDQGVN